MAKKNFSDRWLKSVKTAEQQVEYYDSGLKIGGLTLALRVSKTGRKTFFVRYRNRSGKKRSYSLEDYPLMNLAEAREKAISIAAGLKDGVDPAEQRRIYKRAETLQQVWDEYLPIASKRLRPSTAKEYERQMEKHVLPKLGGYNIRDIKRQDIKAIIREIEADDNFTLARKVRGTMHVVFRFALDEDIIDANPCSGLPRMRKAAPRDRVLSDDEIKSFWAATGNLKPDMKHLFRLQLVTGQRPSDVMGASWSEIDFEAKLWTIPGERYKTHRTHVVPLSDKAVNLLKAQRMYNEGLREKSRAKDITKFDRYVFPGHRNGHINSLSHTRSRLIDKYKLNHFTNHDLRRTVRSGLSKLRIDREVKERVIGHVQTELIQTYDCYDYLDEKRQALSKWARHLDYVVQKKKAKVVNIR